MAVTLNPGRQQSRWAIQTINYADLVSGIAATISNLPVGAMLVGGAIVVNTAFNSATSDTLSLGDSSSATRYANGVNIHATGRTALTLTGYKTLPTTRALQATWTGSGAAPSAGSVELHLEYIVSGRADATQD